MDIAAFERETLLIDETVLQTARTRIAMVMRQCGVDGSPSMPDNAKAYENVDSAMAKQMTAMDAMVKKCNEAARAMTKEQSQMGTRSNAIARGHAQTPRAQQVEGFYNDVAPSWEQNHGHKPGGGKGEQSKKRDRSRSRIPFPRDRDRRAGKVAGKRGKSKR